MRFSAASLEMQRTFLLREALPVVRSAPPSSSATRVKWRARAEGSGSTSCGERRVMQFASAHELRDGPWQPSGTHLTDKAAAVLAGVYSAAYLGRRVNLFSNGVNRKIFTKTSCRREALEGRITQEWRFTYLACSLWRRLLTPNAAWWHQRRLKGDQRYDVISS